MAHLLLLIWGKHMQLQHIGLWIKVFVISIITVGVCAMSKTEAATLTVGTAQGSPWSRGRQRSGSCRGWFRKQYEF